MYSFLYSKSHLGSVPLDSNYGLEQTWATNHNLFNDNIPASALRAVDAKQYIFTFQSKQKYNEQNVAKDAPSKVREKNKEKM